MKIESKDLKKIGNNLQLLRSNKLSAEQSMLLFVGFSYDLVLNKSIFKQNIDLEDFSNIYVKYSNKKEPLRPYLFGARPLLGARLGKIITNDMDYADILEITKELDLFFEKAAFGDQESLMNKSVVKKSLDDETSNWMKSIGKDK